MAKMVGYACSIRLQWLNKAFQMLKENIDEAAYKGQLNEYLAFEIESPTRLRKTREILMNVWYREDSENVQIRRSAMRLMDKYPDYSAAINLCMIYMSYPVVADICIFMGHMFEAQDEITNAMLKQKLFDTWGERGSLEATSRRVTLTLKEMDILGCASKTRYILNKQTITKDEVVNFLICAAMKIENHTYCTFGELKDFYSMFPFEYKVSKEQLMLDERFVLTNFGGELSVALKDNE